ncbi:MAG: PadR family transcriptional regulator [Saprospiraceae bacterium]|jgi:PadR family transcriptional regulator PadR|nr:PadR family transcriptional regulator [Saprospiraceae bacterium]
MKLENTIAQMKKGVLEMCILSIIEEKDAYPSDIIEKLKEAELLVVEGTLYPLLTRLKNFGLLDYYWQESNSGPPRKYYKITESGNTALSELKTNWNQFINSVNQTIKPI